MQICEYMCKISGGQNQFFKTHIFSSQLWNENKIFLDDDKFTLTTCLILSESSVYSIKTKYIGTRGTVLLFRLNIYTNRQKYLHKTM